MSARRGNDAFRSDRAWRYGGPAETEEELHALIQGLSDVVLVIDGDGRYVKAWSSRPELLARPADELVGYTMAERLPADVATAALGAVRDALAAGRTIEMEYSLPVLAGERWFAAAVVPMSENRVLWVARDETERRRIYEALRQAQKMEAVGRLAGGIAHDFNNILTAIGGIAELMLGEVGEDDPLREDLVDIRANVGQATNLTRQLLAFSRKQIIQPDVIDVNASLTNAERLLRRLLGEDLELELRLADDLPAIRADAAQMEQVVFNLAVNARDAMPAGGRLVLSTARRRLAPDEARRYPGMTEGEYVVLVVADTGSGIPKSLLPHIFEPFFTTKGPERGTGLGLATVYGIVRQSGGWVTVESEEGRGSTFEVFLPATDEAPAQAAPAAPVLPAQGSETILLVEDEASVRGLARRMLIGLGYSVLAAHDGVAAFEMARAYEGTIDLLLTDVVMPRAGGKELADVLIPERPATAVLFMSGYTEDTISHHGVLNQGVAFLQKPFTTVQLARAVRSALDRRQPS